MESVVRIVKRMTKRLPYLRTLVGQRDQALQERDQALRERDRARWEKEQLSAVVALTTEPVAEAFHKLYYGSAQQTWLNTFWLGVPTQKFPSDMWIYQEIIFEIRPSLVIETGTADGGSALFLASVLDLLNEGRIISIDIRNVGDRLQDLPVHRRIQYVGGSSVAPETVETVRRSIQPEDRVMLILDSDHSKNHVLQELLCYCEFVSPGSYLIVEDTNVNGHPVFPEHGEGPREALEVFLAQERRFIPDSSREKFFVTTNPRGYLKRILPSYAEQST